MLHSILARRRKTEQSFPALKFSQVQCFALSPRTFFLCGLGMFSRCVRRFLSKRSSFLPRSRDVQVGCLFVSTCQIDWHTSYPISPRKSAGIGSSFHCDPRGDAKLMDGLNSHKMTGALRFASTKRGMNVWYHQIHENCANTMKVEGNALRGC